MRKEFCGSQLKRPPEAHTGTAVRNVAPGSLAVWIERVLRWGASRHEDE
jgi:hypothetical protein